MKKAKKSHSIIIAMHNYLISNTNIEPPVGANIKKSVRVHFKIQNKQMFHILMTSTLLNVLEIKIP